jgi:hypothetical protein
VSSFLQSIKKSTRTNLSALLLYLLPLTVVLYFVNLDYFKFLDLGHNPATILAFASNRFGEFVQIITFGFFFATITAGGSFFVRQFGKVNLPVPILALISLVSNTIIFYLLSGIIGIKNSSFILFGINFCIVLYFSTRTLGNLCLRLKVSSMSCVFSYF